ncbi:hypothetical protein CHS0354_023522 [Potamilus streckersoni]|uniref:VWFC domain-containing protein n=1 Tax=Potamilus streckersoni TaxID=2493646 RepID=A0AAE0RVB4_9BIVA|nr:hypothetical protein CHS0354_023522 [Potamilus streckersoni]
MGFCQPKKCLILFLAMLPVMCKADDEPGCSGLNGKYYRTGDIMPTTHPCETDCICNGHDEVKCNVSVCAMLQCANPIHIEGKCCPVCGCEQSGLIYNPGDAMKSANNCEMNCICGDAGQRVCAMMACPQCEHPIQKDGECCPQCICKDNGQIYNAGKTEQKQVVLIHLPDLKTNN